MKDEKELITKHSYFAAANGYSGFRSYFSNIFNPTDFDSIYVMKGGPGTGKSSYIKKLLLALDSKCEHCEAIYCSSDTNSLDGAIFENKGVRVAILDGTAPHTTDPSYPGAIERIINLGDFWNTSLLKGNRAEIERINSQKHEAYAMAYNYLHICGQLNAMTDDIMQKIYKKDDRSKIAALISETSGSSGMNEIRLISSYGKNGFISFDTYNKISKSVYNVVGIYGSEYIFMDHLKNALDYQNIDYVLSPSALSGDDFDAIYLKSSNIAFVVDKDAGGSEQVIDTSVFLDQKLLSAEKERMEFLWKEREIMLWNSSDEFKKASEEHFKLEKIYTAAMEFSKIDKIYEDNRRELCDELQIE